MKMDSIYDGKAFDWGRISKYCAKYRDIYPEEFYQYILMLGIYKKGQNVLVKYDKNIIRILLWVMRLSFVKIRF